MAHRIDGDGAVADQNGAGKDGFSDDYPNRTVVTDDWMNDMQETVYQYIESRGITLVKEDFTQLIDAISTHFPASSTDNHVCRFDGATGEIIQDGSPVVISDAGAVSGVTDVGLSGEVTYASGKTRTKFIPCARLIGDGWGHGGPSPRAIGNANSAYGTVPLSDIIPSGCTVTRFRVGVTVGTNNAGSDRVTVCLARTIPNTSTGASTLSGTVGTPSNDGGGTGDKVITHTPTPYVVIDGETLEIAIKASVSAGAINDFVNWIEVQFTDIGPRNA